MDELALVKDAVAGDLDAFNRLVLAYQDSAFNLAFRMLGDADQAADVTQIAFLSAWKNLRSYRGGTFRGWLMRMVTNASYDELRRRHRHPTIPLEPVSDDEEIDSACWLASDDPSPEESAEHAELEKVIQHCLTDLPDDFRAVVVMIDILGMDYAEVSVAIGKPLGTIKSRLARARLRMRRGLQRYWVPPLLSLSLEDEAAIRIHST